ncbi:hypothetical protein WG68_06520 [Arsukibacterium ikkense]|uniref:Uncharacterized protein n=1 Tax=Arsukibacterium ikkense TaxID=336831 RepID=A0A0M2VB92_9GAMM|nr:hypothetical protein WG68_06520 [Arsukibacterium ikkense]
MFSATVKALLRPEPVLMALCHVPLTLWRIRYEAAPLTAFQLVLIVVPASSADRPSGVAGTAAGIVTLFDALDQVEH